MQLVPWAVGQLLDMAQATRGQRNIVGTISVSATPHQCFELHKARTKATPGICSSPKAQHKVSPFASAGRSSI